MEEKSWNNEILIAPVVHRLEGERWWQGLAEFNKPFVFGICQSPMVQGFGPHAQKKKNVQFWEGAVDSFSLQISLESFIKIKAYFTSSFSPQNF